MKIYTALLKPNAEPVLVREAFAWGALLFGPVWLALCYRAWIAAAITLAAYILIAVFVPGPAKLILITGMALILGFIGHELHRLALESRGYLLAHVLAGRDRDEAWMRLLAHRPDVAARFRPEPA